MVRVNFAIYLVEVLLLVSTHAYVEISATVLYEVGNRDCTYVLLSQNIIILIFSPH